MASIIKKHLLKFGYDTAGTKEVTLVLTDGAEVVSVGEQDGNIYLWECHNEQLTVQSLVLDLLIVGTGVPFTLPKGKRKKFLGTVMTSHMYDWHVYRLDEF